VSSAVADDWTITAGGAPFWSFFLPTTSRPAQASIVSRANTN
jgi:hypothetical protein